MATWRAHRLRRASRSRRRRRSAAPRRASAGVAPKIALAISVRPLPTRPNMPTISPARTLKLTSSKMSPSVSFSTSSTGLPASPFRSGKIAESGRPTMAWIRRSWSSSATGARQHAAPVLQHHDLVGDLEDFLQPVRDVEDGRAGGGEAAHLVEQLRGFGGREHRGRLVEDQDLRFGDERLGDLDDLLARDAERARPARPDRSRESRNRRARARRCGSLRASR